MVKYEEDTKSTGPKFPWEGSDLDYQYGEDLSCAPQLEMVFNWEKVFALYLINLIAIPFDRMIKKEVKVAIGFYVVVPDFFYGDPYVPEIPLSSWFRNHLPAKGAEDARKAVADLISKGASVVGVAGFCWGGMTVFGAWPEKAVSSKQSTTAMSATEAEYIAASEAAMEAVWIRKFISGLGIVPTINEPIKMFCDNSAALLIANEPGVQKGARHYHRRYHYVRECIELGEINLLKVHTDDNLADPFTKALPKGKLTQHARSIGLRLASSFM
ncbi:putative retrotransposon protein [Tanacetum coccineum]